MRLARLAAIALLIVGCGGTAATPIVIYLTPVPTTAAPAVSQAPASALPASPAPTAPASTSTLPAPTQASGLHNITVYLTIYGKLGHDFVRKGAGCTGAGGYSDVKLNQQFEIKDKHGELLGFGYYEKSKLADDDSYCDLIGTANDVPEADPYVIGGDRGSIDFAFSEVQTNGWIAYLTLGNAP